MSFDLRSFNEEQKKVMRKCAEKSLFKVKRHWKLWAKPIRARICIMPFLRELKQVGVSQETYKEFLEDQKILQVHTTEDTSIELVFLWELSDSEVMELLVDHDIEARRMGEERRIIRHNLKIRSLE